MMTMKTMKTTTALKCKLAFSGWSKCGVVIIGIAIVGLSGCGQKGGLYLDSANQQAATSSDVLASTSRPEDAAFAGLDDNDQQGRYSEQQQTLPEPSADPNDY